MTDPSTWRSVLFLSPLSSRHLEKAPACGADAIQLDLEDAVPPDRKDDARAALKPAVQGLRKNGVENVVVRVNRPWRLAIEDLKSAVACGADVVTLPKVENPGHVTTIGEMLDELEADRGHRLGATRLLLLIETAEGLGRLDCLCAASKRSAAVALGPEDFALDLRGQPTVRANTAANLEVLCAARRNGLMAFGYPGTIAELSDLEAFRAQVELARELGFSGGLAVHPRQVAILNEVFSPSAEQVAYARKVIKAAEEAAGRAVVVDGKMIDLPIVQRARQLVASAT